MLLGHSSADTTEIYAERNLALLQPTCGIEWWLLAGIAAGLPKGDRRIDALNAAAEAHAAAALPAVTGEHYEGGHWLGTFAVYLTTRAGLQAP